MYEQMEVVNKFWLARGCCFSEDLRLSFETQLYAMSCPGSLEDSVDKSVKIVVA